MGEIMDISMIPSGRDPPNIIYVIVNIPKGSKAKYNLAKFGQYSYFVLDEIFSESLLSSNNFGIIPHTWYDDCAPLDVILITEQPLFYGCIVEARPVGLLELLSADKKDDKVLAVPLCDKKFSKVRELEDVSKNILYEIISFFSAYNTLNGRNIEILGWKNRYSAEKAINHAIKLYNQRIDERVAQENGI
jgi:inorganic pyrophosphatase